MNVVFILFSTAGTLDGRSAIQFETITAAYLFNTIMASDLQPPLLYLKVNTNIASQSVITTANNNNGTRRWLQSATLNPLKIAMDVELDYRTQNLDFNASTAISNAFNSNQDRNAYLQTLRNTGDPIFANLQTVQVFVDGVSPPGDTTSNPQSKIWVIVGSSLGGSIVAIGLGYFGYTRFKTTTTRDEDDEDVDGIILPQFSTDCSQNKPGYSTEILVERQDDVSTLGDPVVYGGMMTSGAESERDERTASVGEDFDYLLNLGGQWIDGDSSGRTRMMSTDSLPVTRQSSSQSGSLSLSKAGMGHIPTSLFADDSSFEQQFREEQEEEKYEIEVPPGRLGMVIDTPNGGIPVVHALKSESVLFNKVKVGDRLIYVDEDDVTNMTALQVSKLISLRSEQKRQLVFVRASH